MAESASTRCNGAWHSSVRGWLTEGAACCQVFDKENKGWISTNELKHVLSNIGEKLAPEEVRQACVLLGRRLPALRAQLTPTMFLYQMEEMLQEADPDKDGKIQCDEFVRMLLAR